LYLLLLKESMRFILLLVLLFTCCRPKEGVKIAATDEEAKSEAMAPPPDIDAQAQAILE
jgi:hypothetical protein